MHLKTLGVTSCLFAASGVIFTSILYGDPPAPPVECKTGLDALGTCFGTGPNGKCNTGCSNQGAGPGTSGIDWINQSVHIHNGTGHSVNGGTAAMNCRRQRNCVETSYELRECDLVTDRCVDIVNPTPDEEYDPPVCTEFTTDYLPWIQSPNAVINPCPAQPAPAPVPVPNTEPITPVPDPLDI